MSPAARWKTLQSIFAVALELSPQQRPSYLEEACGGDTDLRAIVDSLLAGDESPRLESAVKPTKGFVAGDRLGAYRIVAVAGEGGMGTVYRATRADGQFEQTVAIKTLRPGWLGSTTEARLIRERGILAALEHPGIARLLDGGLTPAGEPYLVMEFVDGRPLIEYAEASNLGERAKLHLFCEVLDAVQYLHRNLVIHRDLKPANILVTPEGKPKLLDFGIAKLASPELESTALTSAFERPLTPEYASPEQLKGESLTTASDVYSAGVLLYELLSGKRPYEVDRQSLAAMEQSVTGATIKRIEGDLGLVVSKAMAREPSQRYESVSALAGDLTRYLNGYPVSAAPPSRWGAALKFANRHRLGVGLTAVALIALTVAAVWVLDAQRRERLRFQQVRSLATSLVFEVDKKLAPMPGGLPARRLIVEKASQYLDLLAADSANDLRLTREVAAAYEELAAIQGNLFASSMGDVTAAMATIAKELPLRERLAIDGGFEDRRRLAQVLASLSDQLSDLNQGRKDALDLIQRALSIVEQLRLEAPNDRRVQIDHAGMLRRLGTIHYTAGRNPEAKRLYEQALKLQKEICAAAPNDDEQQRMLGETYYSLGLPYAGDVGLEGSPEQGLAMFEKAMEITGAVAARNPTNPVYLRHFGSMQNAVGVALNRVKRQSDAIEVIRKSIVTLTRALELEKTDKGTAQFLLNSKANLLLFLLRSDRFDEAVAHGTPLSAEIMAAGKPGAADENWRASRVNGDLLQWFAEALAGAGKPDEARRGFDQSLLRRDSHLKTQPNDPRATRDWARTAALRIVNSHPKDETSKRLFPLALERLQAAARADLLSSRERALMEKLVARSKQTND